MSFVCLNYNFKFVSLDLQIGLPLWYMVDGGFSFLQWFENQLKYSRLSEAQLPSSWHWCEHQKLNCQRVSAAHQPSEADLTLNLLLHSLVSNLSGAFHKNQSPCSDKNLSTSSASAGDNPPVGTTLRES